jgi:hypothetical protein
MKNITVTTQAQLDAITRIEVDECVTVETSLRLNTKIEVLGTIILKADLECNWYAGIFLVVPEKSAPRIEARGSSAPRIVAWGSSAPRIEAWESSAPRIVAWGSSAPRIEARGSSAPRIEAWGSSAPRIEAWESSAPRIVAWGSSAPSIVAWGSSAPRIEAWESAVLRLLGLTTSRAKFVLNGFSVLMMDAKFKANIQKGKHAVVQRVHDLGWFERNGVKKTKEITLYKRVSKDWKTQENTPNETVWAPDTTVDHKAWNPDEQECGPGKFHGCPKPYFCDEFRDVLGDRYVAIRVALKDLHEWKNPKYPHKIGFRKGVVLFECDWTGKAVKK